MNKVIYVCSPYSGNVELNTQNAEKCSRFVVSQGCVPITPHLMFPRFMDDNNPEDRTLAMRMGMRLIDKCDELWWFGNNPTKGMAEEIGYALRMNIPTHNILVPRKFVVVTNGYSRSGKDTFCAAVQDVLRWDTTIEKFGKVQFVRYSYVDFTRNMLSSAGVDIHNKDGSLRELLVKVNKALEEYADVPFADICKKIEEPIPEGCRVSVIMVDARDPAVIKRIARKYDNVCTLLVHRPGTEPNVGDERVDDFAYDVSVLNSSLEDLKDYAKRFAYALLSTTHDRKPAGQRKGDDIFNWFNILE